MNFNHLELASEHDFSYEILPGRIKTSADQVTLLIDHTVRVVAYRVVS